MDQADGGGSTSNGRFSDRLLGIQYVCAVFAAVLVVGAVVTALCAIEIKGRVLEEIAP